MQRSSQDLPVRTYVPPHLRNVNPVSNVQFIRVPNSRKSRIINNDQNSADRFVNTPNLLSQAPVSIQTDVIRDGVSGPPLTKRDRRLLIERAKNFHAIPLLYGTTHLKRKIREELNKLLPAARSLFKAIDDDIRKERLDQICSNKGWKAEDCVFCQERSSSFVEHVLSQDHIEAMIQRKVYPTAADCNLIIITLNTCLSSQNKGETLQLERKRNTDKIVSKRMVSLTHEVPHHVTVSTVVEQTNLMIAGNASSADEHSQVNVETVVPITENYGWLFSEQECDKNFRNTPLLCGESEKHNDKHKRKKKNNSDPSLGDARNLYNSLDDSQRIQLDQICANKGWKAEYCSFCQDQGSLFLEHVLSQDHIEKMLQEKVFPRSSDSRQITSTLKTFITSSELGNVNSMHKQWSWSCRFNQGTATSRSIRPSSSQLHCRRYRLPIFDPYRIIENSIDVTDSSIRCAIDSIWRSKRFRKFAMLLEKKMFNFFANVTKEGSFLGCESCRTAFSTWYTLIDHALSRRHIEKMIQCGYCFDASDFELILNVYKEVCSSKKKNNKDNSVDEETTVIEDEVFCAATLENTDRSPVPYHLDYTTQLPVAKENKMSRRSEKHLSTVGNAAVLKQPELFYNAVDGIRPRSGPGKRAATKKENCFAKMGGKFWTTPLLSGAFRKLSQRSENEVNGFVIIARSLLNECKNRSKTTLLNQICHREGWIVWDCVCCPKDIMSFMDHVLSEDHLNRLIGKRMFPLKLHLERIIAVLEYALFDEDAIKHSLPFLHGTADVEKQISDDVLLPILSFQRTAISSFPSDIVEVVLVQEFEIPRKSACSVCASKKKISLGQWIYHLTSQHHLNKLIENGRRASRWDISTVGLFIKRCETRYVRFMELQKKREDETADVHCLESNDNSDSDFWLNYMARRCSKNSDLGRRLSLCNTSIVGKRESEPCKSSLPENECEMQSAMKKNEKQPVVQENQSPLSASKQSKKNKPANRLTTEKKGIDLYRPFHSKLLEVKKIGRFDLLVDLLGRKIPKLFEHISKDGFFDSCKICEKVFVNRRNLMDHAISLRHILKVTEYGFLFDQVEIESVFEEVLVTGKSSDEKMPALTDVIDSFFRSWKEDGNVDDSSSESSSDEEISQYSFCPETIAPEFRNDVPSVIICPKIIAAAKAVSKRRLFVNKCKKQQEVPLLFGALEKRNFIGKVRMNNLVNEARGLLELCQIDTRKIKWLNERCIKEGWNVRKCVICRCKLSQLSYIQHILSEEHLDKMIHKRIYPIKEDLLRIIEALNI